MKDLKISEILEYTEGTLVSGCPEDTVNTISTDSRVIPENCLFVPIVGERMDGHDFLGGALEKAKAVLTSRPAMDGIYNENGAEEGFENANIILVEDTITALQQVGKLARTKVNIPAVGVTGSVGKTTTREMVSYALSGAMKVYKTDKNYNNKIGVPLTLSEMTEESDIAVLELGLNVRNELGTISALTNIETAMITNIGVAHIEYYGTRDEICKEKFTVTKGFWPENPAPKMLFLNGDDTYLMKYKDLTGYAYKTYAIESDESDYYARNIEIKDGLTTFDLMKNGEKVISVTLSVLGKHNVLNAVGALAVADYYKVPLRKAAESLSKFTGFRHRLERFEKDGVMIIDDTYNASPASMKAGVSVLSDMVLTNTAGRRIAVLGDMLELGEQTKEYHYEVGEYAATEKVDLLFLLGENSREIGRAYKEHGGKAEIQYFMDGESLLETLKKTVKAGDFVYFKASHGTNLGPVVEGLLK